MIALDINTPPLPPKEIHRLCTKYGLEPSFARDATGKKLCLILDGKGVPGDNPRIYSYSEKEDPFDALDELARGFSNFLRVLDQLPE